MASRDAASMASTHCIEWVGGWMDGWVCGWEGAGGWGAGGGVVGGGRGGGGVGGWGGGGEWVDDGMRAKSYRSACKHCAHPY